MTIAGVRHTARWSWTGRSTPVARITLNRPERLNAMNVDLLAGLYDALDALRVDRTCRVIVLTGAGRGFCAGLDLTEGASLPDLAGPRPAPRPA